MMLTREERQSGRTTALLEQALQGAREGKTVYFFVAHEPMRFYAQALAERIAKAHINRASGMSEAFPGRLRVVSRKTFSMKQLRGVGANLLVVQDHYWE